MYHAHDLRGLSFGRLTVIEDSGRRVKTRGVVWKCRCECGNVAFVHTGNIRRGHTRSCGCLYMEAVTKHGSSRDSGATREYRVWNAMKNRCRNPSDPNFHHYGGRGITFSERWKDFQNFIDDMGLCPIGLTLERIDNSKNYEPGNCKWATRSEQARNTRRNRMLTFNNQTLCLTDWAVKCGLDRRALESRLRSGWDVSRALTEPRHKRASK